MLGTQRPKGCVLHQRHKDEHLWLPWINLGFSLDFIGVGVLSLSTLSFGSLLMVFSGLRTRSTRRDLIVLMSRPLLFLWRRTGVVRVEKPTIYHPLWSCSLGLTGWSLHI